MSNPLATSCLAACTCRSYERRLKSFRKNDSYRLSSFFLFFFLSRGTLKLRLFFPRRPGSPLKAARAQLWSKTKTVLSRLPAFTKSAVRFGPTPVTFHPASSPSQLDGKGNKNTRGSSCFNNQEALQWHRRH